MRIRSAVEKHGAQRIAKALGMSRDSVLALAAGAHVRDGTLALAEQRIERLTETGNENGK
ncbi:MAG: hypothetical protein ABSC94_30140 [Polyangiaceae bacterium]|jgi:hypothetical protein